MFIDLDKKWRDKGIEIWRASKNILEPISKTVASKIRGLME